MALIVSAAGEVVRSLDRNLPLHGAYTQMRQGAGITPEHPHIHRN
jgi:hypothetical protein